MWVVWCMYVMDVVKQENTQLFDFHMIFFFFLFFFCETEKREKDGEHFEMINNK